MPTSGSINYSTSTQEIITEALELLGVLGEGEAYNTNQYESARRTLNSMVKMWQADHLNLFAVQEGYLFLEAGRPYYDLNFVTEDLFTTNFGQRFVDGDVTAPSNTITLDDAGDAGIGFYIGIATTGTEMFWTTITNIVGNVVTIADPIDEDVSDGAPVFYFQEKANRPMRILEAYLHKRSGTDIPLDILARVDYYTLSNKSANGQVTQVYYDPQIASGRLFVWPTSASELDYIRLIMQRTLDDFDNDTDEPDYPQEWYMPLAYNLAVALAPKYGTPQMDYTRIAQLAEAYYNTAKYWDSEQETSIFLKPNTWGMDIGRRGA